MPGRGRGRGKKRRAETEAVDNEERQVRRRLRSNANRALEEDRGENILPTIDFETILCNSDCAPPQERGCGADTREQGGFPSGILPSSPVDTDAPHAPFFNLTSGMEINPNPFRTPDDFLKGCRRLNQKPDSRAPITKQILQRIIDNLALTCHDSFETTMFKAAYSLTYFGLFRTYGYWETASPTGLVSLRQQKETWSITRQSLGGGYGVCRGMTLHIVSSWTYH
ncbi:hypothetical protein ACF0H5_015922 [Mactra antiquata]